MASGVFGQFVEDMGSNAKAFNLLTDTIKYVFVDDSLTPDFDTDEDYADISADEVTGTGYTTGGEALAGKSWAAAGGYCTFDANDVSLPGTTLTDVRGICLIDDTLADDPLLIAMTFGGDF